jgi:hypothetical protein
MRPSPPISSADPELNAEVTATHMVSAVTYLIRVAEDAGLARIGRSLELLRSDLVQTIADMRADDGHEETHGRPINHH